MVGDTGVLGFVESVSINALGADGSAAVARPTDASIACSRTRNAGPVVITHNSLCNARSAV